MWQLISTTVFSILVTTSSLFILMTALPIFIQLALGRDVNVRIWDVVLIGLPYFVTVRSLFMWNKKANVLTKPVECCILRLLVAAKVYTLSSDGENSEALYCIKGGRSSNSE